MVALAAAALATTSPAVASTIPPQRAISETVTSFRDSANDAGRAVLVQPDGKVVSAGTAGGDFGIHRQTSGGLADEEFGVDGWVTTDFGANDGVNAVVLDASGRVVAAGWTGGDIAVARYEPGGQLDRTFGSDGRVVTDLGAPDDVAYGVAIDSTGRVVVSAGNQVAMVVLRFRSDGTLDPTFGQSGLVRVTSDGPARALAVASGRILLAGGGGQPGLHVAALTSDGTLEAGFGVGGNVRVPLGAPAWATGIATLPDGRILVAGERSGDVVLARLDPSGHRDASYGSVGVVVSDFGRTEHPHGLVAAADGSAFVTGDAGPQWGFLASYLPNGSLDARFAEAGWIEQEGSEWWGATAEADANVAWITIGTWNRNFSMQRWGSVGSRNVVDSTWDAAHVSERAQDAARLPDGRWVVLAETSGQIGIVRYHADGRLDTSFGRNGRVVSDLALRPRGMVVQSTGRIVVAGHRGFDLALVAFQADGALDRAWGMDAGRTVTDTGTSWIESPQGVDLLADDVIAVVGYDERGSFLAHYRSDGTLDPRFGRGGLVVAADAGEVTTVVSRNTVIQPDGRTLVAGGGLEVRRYNTDGSVDRDFANGGTLVPAPGTFSAGGSTPALALLPTGKILVGERYYVAGRSQFAIARYNPDGTVDRSFPTVHTPFRDSMDPTAHVGTGGVLDFIVLPDGRFLAVSVAQVVRYLPNGGLDLTFGDRGTLLLERTLGNYAAVDHVVESSIAADGVITLIGSGQVWAPGSGVKIARYPAARPGASSVQAWGWNVVGELGAGGTLDQLRPAPVKVLTNVVDVAAGVYHSLALRADGTVWAWGWNAVGQLGDGTTTDRHTAVQVPWLTDVVEISAGAYHSLALRRDGTVMAWGWNVVGQLGDGTTIDRHSPVPVNLRTVTGIAAGGFHSLAVTSSGYVYGWGWNVVGQLGDGTTIDRHSPTAVPKDDWMRYEVVAAGTYHSLALREGGTIAGWGSNMLGQLGDSTTVDRHSPVSAASSAGFVSISGGGLHSLARHGDGSVWAWGWNALGQLGDGTTVDRRAPAPVPRLRAVDVAAGVFHNSAVTRGGEVLTWGWNGRGQLGTGATADRTAPTAVLASPPAAVVAAGGFHTLAR